MNRYNRDGHRVLIVGCGALGSRHLQVVSALPMVKEIEVMDPRPKALAKGRQLLSAMPQRQSSVSFRWVNSIEEATAGGDLCIIATQAKRRGDLVFQVNELLGYRNFLIEKAVTQTVGDYERFLEFAKKRCLSVWVHSFVDPIVSHTTKTVALDILSHGRCELPTLEDCVP